jgi:hypothetical protein
MQLAIPGLEKKYFWSFKIKISTLIKTLLVNPSKMLTETNCRE